LVQPTHTLITNLSPEDRADLEEAVRSLEKPGFAPKLIAIIGLPLDKGDDAAPEDQRALLQAVGMVPACPTPDDGCRVKPPTCIS